MSVPVSPGFFSDGLAVLGCFAPEMVRRLVRSTPVIGGASRPFEWRKTMLFVARRIAIAVALFAITFGGSGLAQVASPVTLRIEYENGVRYVYDSVDVPAFA